MSFGGDTPKPPPKPAPLPVRPQQVEIEASKQSLQERLKRAKGRESTKLTQPGTLFGTNGGGGMKSTLG